MTQSAASFNFLATLQSKVTAPSSPAQEVRREAIAKKIDLNAGIKLVLVHGPAGFGKTTVLSQLQRQYEQQGISTTWLTLDNSDNDLSRFLVSLSAALDKISPENNNSNEAQAEEVSKAAEKDAGDVIVRVMNRINKFNRPVVAFFDEFEVLHNPVVVQLIASRAELLPPKSVLIIGSRTIPDMGIPRMRARGLLTEIDTELLRFSEEETRHYIGRATSSSDTTTQQNSESKTSFTDDQIQTLRRSTEGWPAALWLASITLEKHLNPDQFLQAFSGSNKAIAEYLAEDVLATLPENLSQFLLDTSVLNELTPDLCDAICGIDHSEQLLEQLLRQNLFLQPIDQTQPRFRYHNLFKDFLRGQLKKTDLARWNKLNYAASLSLQKAGRPIPAINYALQSDQRAAAIDLLLEHGENLLRQGRMRLLNGMLSQLSPEELDKEPLLKVFHAWCTTFAISPDQALAMINALQENKLPTKAATYLRALRPMLLAIMDRIEEAHTLGMQAISQDEPTSAETSKYPFAQAMLYQALTQTSIILGEHELAYQFMDTAREAQIDGTGAFGQVLAESAEAILDLISGRLTQASSRMQMATENFAASRDKPQLGNPLAAIEFAETLYEAGDTEGTVNILQVYYPLVKDLGPTDALISAHVILARIYNSQNKRDKALNLLNELENCGHRLKLPRAIASARLERANHSLSHKDTSHAARQLAQAEKTIDWSKVEANWYLANDVLNPTTVRLRLLIASGKHKEAIPAIKEALDTADSKGRDRRALKMRILLAMALYADGETRRAMRSLGHAVDIASAEGFVQTFLEEGPGLISMLKELNADNSTNLNKDWFSQLVKNPKQCQPSTQPSALIEPLTPKEMNVLQLLAQGNSNNDMAEALFVSESTVRTHLRNINLKLQAKNRTQAIVLARELGLIQS